MGCNCGGARANAQQGGDTLGYRAILPGGEVIPPADQPPYFMAAEAMRHVSIARGGTVRRIRRDDPDDAYAITQRAEVEQPVPLDVEPTGSEAPPLRVVS